MKTLKTVVLFLVIFIISGAAFSEEARDAKRFFEKGNEQFNSGQYDAAIEAYSRAVSAYPDFTDAYYNRGLSYYKKGRYAEAIEDYGRAIAKDPGNVQLYNNRGLAYLKNAQYGNAIEDYNKVISLNPSAAAEAYHNRGIAYANSGKFDEAIEDYSRVISQKPQDVNVYISRGVAYVKKALEDFKKACDMGNKNACDDVKNLSK